MRPLQLTLLGFVVLLLAQAFASYALQSLRPEFREREQDSFFRELPPGEVAGTLMLGGFRGMAIDFLWLRAVQAKEAGRFHESVALFDLISRVQPRFERVWEYMAWDMAYNIGHEVDQENDKWSWYLAGLKANLRGVTVNPDSERLLRHLAWMYFHKGEHFMRRIEDVDWRPIVQDAVAIYQDDIPLPDQESLSSFQLAEYFYRLSVLVGERQHDRQPAFVRRMVPLAVDRDGNRLRNRGQHFQALQRYVDALAAWQVIKAWTKNPTGHYRSGIDQTLSDESYQRNEGLLRRKMINLAGQLSVDTETADAFSAAVQQRDIEDCRSLLQQRERWREHIRTSTTGWLDEP